MKKSLIAIVAALLVGCASIDNAGYAGYDVKCAKDNGCSLSAKDGKEFSSRIIQFNAATGQLIVQEGESKAFKGQALAVKAINMLPTMGLGDIIAPRDK